MKTIIFGNNEIALMARFYLDNDSPHETIGFCIDGQYIKEQFANELPVIPFEDIEKEFDPKGYRFFAPLYSNKLRAEKAAEITAKGYSLISYVSSKAVVWSETIGSNCFIMENNVIQPFVKVGNNVILWSGNHIGHHSTIEDNVFFSSHVVLSGKCHVEKYAWFGVNSAIRDSIHIAEGSFIGMGSVVIKDTKPYTKYIGNPAKEYGDVV